MDESLKVKTLSGITEDLISKAVSMCTINGTVYDAPLGSSGDSYILYSCFKKEESECRRDRQVSIRLYNDTVELLLTDDRGRFIFHGKYNNCLGVAYISRKFHEVVCDLESYLNPCQSFGKIENSSSQN